MVPRRRLSPQTNAVLLALAEDPTQWRYGYDLCRSLGLKAGTVYPILIRLAERGYVVTEWEKEAPPGRPPRHLYRLSPRGIEAVRRATESGSWSGTASRVKPLAADGSPQ